MTDEFVEAEFPEILDAGLVEVEEKMDDYYIGIWMRAKYRDWDEK